LRIKKLNAKQSVLKREDQPFFATAGGKMHGIQEALNKVEFVK
jgi:hypothetical protein